MLKDYTYSAFTPDDTPSPKARQGADSRAQAPKGKRQPRKPQGASWFDRTIAFFTNRKTKAIMGIALILFACYLVVAALSFLRNGAADQSIVTSEHYSTLAAEPGAVANAAGPVGAKLSHNLFVEGLGLGSLVLIVYIVLLGLALLEVRRTRFWSLTFKSLILAITISMVLGLFTVHSSATLPLGGYHGRYINELLISNIGWIGAFVVSCLLVAIVVTIFIAELTAIYNKSREKVNFIKARTAYLRDKEKYTVEKVREGLSEGPINNDPKPTPEAVKKPQQPVEVTLEDITSAEEAPKGGAFGQSSSTSKDDKPQGATPRTTNNPDNPDFDIHAADEIEQGSQAATLVALEGPYDPKAELSRYRMPGLDLLMERPRKANNVDLAEQEENKERITKTLNDYGIQIAKIDATVGPTVTLYEIVPAEGVRIARIKRLEDDIALSLAALGIRIIAPIPGRGTIGIEVPNKDPQTVSIRSILGSKAYQECKYPLPMALGATINNEVYIADLTKMPHLLVAGATGQGKSVGLNTIIASLLYKRHPSELKFVLVDPKMVEFSLYARIEKHYLAKLPDAEEPVVTNPAKVVDTLNSLCVEMDSRYALLKDAGCRSVIEYNDKFINRRLNPEKGHRYMPYIVMIVDEFADLIMMSGKAVELPIARIAQKARAVGMHMIIATQRPSTNVITGIIKANFPGRIGFRVSQMVDSRTILDAPGANQLIGRGDMLITSNGSMVRVQCAFIDTPEVEAICEHIDNQIGFPTAYILPDPPTDASDTQGGSAEHLAERDPLFDEIARLVVQGSTASTSNIQRRYSIGYNRAGKIMDQLEAAGIVGPSTGGKPRQVLVDPTQLEGILAALA